MATADRPIDPDVPDWVRQEWSKLPPPGPQDLTPGEAELRAEFLAAIHRAGRLRQRAAAPRPEVVFSMAGRLIALVAGVVRGIVPPPPQRIPVRVAVRGPGTRAAGADTVAAAPEAPLALDRVFKISGTARLELTTYLAGERLEVEINLVDSFSGTDIRPFEIVVVDAENRQITDPIRIDWGSQPPRYPGPQPGFYALRASWEGGRAELMFEFQ